VEKTKVMIGMLTGGFMIHASQVILAHQLPIWSASPNCPYSFTLWIEAGTSPQEFARNKIIKEFLDSECDILMMVDDDMILTGKAIELLETPGDWHIVGPLQYMFQPANPERGRMKPEAYPCAFNRDKSAPIGSQTLPCWPVMGEGTVSEVAAVGSGVMAIKREVLLDRRLMVKKNMDPPAFFKNRYDRNGKRLRGLDIDFCWRAGDLGYKVMVNWAVEVGHYKRVNLNDIDFFAKGSFMDGMKAQLLYDQNQKGNPDELQVAGVEGGPNGGTGGMAESGGGDAGLAQGGVDRAGGEDEEGPGEVARRAAG